MRASEIKNNTQFIAPVIDTDTKTYLSKAVAAAVIDGLSYINQHRLDKDQPERATSRPVMQEPAATSTSQDGSTNTTASATPSTPADIDAMIAKIGSALADIRGTSS